MTLRHSVRCAAMAILCCVVVSAPALGQHDDLPNEVVTAGQALNDAQQRAVNQYVDHWIDGLNSGSDARVVQSRKQLVEPLKLPIATAIFKKAYSTAVSARLLRATNSKDTLTRVNAQIVAGELVDPGAVAIVEVGIKDASPGVRYHGGKAVASVAANIERFPEADQRKLLAVLVDALAKEEEPQVIRGLLEAMASLPLTDARATVLQVLNDRVPLHAMDPGKPMGAEVKSLRTIFTNVIRESAQSDSPPPTRTTRALAQTAFRYMLLSSMIMDKGVVDEVHAADLKQMVERADQVLAWAVPTLAPEHKDALPKDRIQTLVQLNQWVQVLLRVEEWRKLLTVPPIQFKANDLAVPPPAEDKPQR